MFYIILSLSVVNYSKFHVSRYLDTRVSIDDSVIFKNGKWKRFPQTKNQDAWIIKKIYRLFISLFWVQVRLVWH